MIESKIILVKNLLDKKSIRYDIEKISDTEILIYCFLSKTINIEELISFWTTLDDLDFRALNGCKNSVDCYQQDGENVVEITSSLKSTSPVYGVNTYYPKPTYTPPPVNKPDVPRLPPASKSSGGYNSNFFDIPKASNYKVKLMEMDTDDKKNYELSSIRADFDNDELDIIDEWIQLSYTQVTGPDMWNEKNEGRVYWECYSPGKKLEIVISIEKFLPEDFLIKMTYFKNFGKTDKYYLCQGIDDIEMLLKDIGWWSPF